MAKTWFCVWTSPFISLSSQWSWRWWRHCWRTPRPALSWWRCADSSCLIWSSSSATAERTDGMRSYTQRRAHRPPASRQERCVVVLTFFLIKTFPVISETSHLCLTVISLDQKRKRVFSPTSYFPSSSVLRQADGAGTFSVRTNKHEQHNFCKTDVLF